MGQPNPWSLASACAGGSLAADLKKKEGRGPLRGASFRKRTGAKRSTSSLCRSFPPCDASYSASPIGAGHGVPRAHDARVPLRADGRDPRPRGWVEEVRNLGSIAFILVRLRDGTVQVAVKKKRDEALFQQLTKLTRESVVRVTGKVVGNKEARQGRELEPTAAEVLAAADAPLPLGVVDHVGR